MLSESDSYKISVIVPFYNSGETISRTINSIETALIKSTISEVQLIFIDNNSTDISSSIVASYCNSRSYTKLYFEPMRGVANARNCGVSNADGKYIAFIDSDDTIDSDYFITLNHAIRSDPDLIVAPNIVPSSIPEIEILSVDRALRRIRGWWCWQFVFRKSMASELKFQGECYEDFGFFPFLIEQCENVTIINKSIYKYNRTAGSLTGMIPELRLFQLECLFNERNFLDFKGKPEIGRRLLRDYFVMKAQLRAMACIWPVLPTSDILRYTRKAPLGLMGTAPKFFYLSVSTAKRRFVNFVKTLQS